MRISDWSSDVCSSDLILLFTRLGRESMKHIVDIQLGRLRRMLADRHVTLELGDQALDWLADAGYDPVYGARPLKRAIQRSLQNQLANRILEGRIRDGDRDKVAVQIGRAHDCTPSNNAHNVYKTLPNTQTH